MLSQANHAEPRVLDVDIDVSPQGRSSAAGAVMLKDDVLCQWSTPALGCARAGVWQNSEALVCILWRYSTTEQYDMRDDMRGFIRAVVTRGLLLQWSVLYASDTNGHAVVAMLAEERLTPQARAAVSERLHGQPLVEVASWADYVRHQQIAPWHYVNIEIDESQYEPACHCPNRHCVIGQIERLHATLAAGAIDPAKREKSLKYLVHFVGDLHQLASQIAQGGL